MVHLPVTAHLCWAQLMGTQCSHLPFLITVEIWPSSGAELAANQDGRRGLTGDY